MERPFVFEVRMPALRTLIAAVGVAVLATSASSPGGQAPQDQQQRPIFRAGTNVVRVDVTVTGKGGEPVIGLTQDDFEVQEDGKPQAIESFQFVRADGLPTDDRELEIRGPEHAAAEAARDDVRLFLIFWDEYHIGQLQPALRGREALTELVLNDFGPTDLVGIMDQLTTVDSIRFTRNRRELADQVHALKGRLGVYVPARSVIEEGHLQFPGDIGRLRNEVSMSALMAAAAFLGNFREGRKTLLFVSQGIPMFIGTSTKPYDDIVRAANTNNTAIYTLDPASEVGRRPISLVALAQDTGGRPFVGSNRPAAQLSQLVRDASAYYLLGYASSAPFDGRFHKIKVRIKKGGFELRARSGYYTSTPGDMERSREKAAASARPADVGQALDQLTTRSDRAIALWVGTGRGTDGRTHVTVVWTPGPAAPADGITASVSATVPDGAVLAETEASAERTVAFDAAPGTIKLSTRALDRSGQELDVDVRSVAVPSFDDGQLSIGTPVVLRARTPREVRTVMEGGRIPIEVGRAFDRTDRLFVQFSVYGGADVTASAHLLNGQGTAMRELPVGPAGPGSYRVDLPLTSVARGDYLIAVEASQGSTSIRSLVALRVR